MKPTVTGNDIFKNEFSPPPETIKFTFYSLKTKHRHFVKNYFFITEYNYLLFADCH